MELVKIEHPTTSGSQVIGIKKAPSKDGKSVFTTYYTVRPWSDYEIDRGDYFLAGYPVEEYQTREDFDINLGDTVVFYYGKAIGGYQPIIDFKLVAPYAGPAAKAADNEPTSKTEPSGKAADNKPTSKTDPSGKG